MLFSALQYIFKPLSGFGCCLFSQAMMLWLLIQCLLLLPLFCAVFCPSVYIQDPQWLRLLSVLTGDDAVVVDLLLIQLFCAVLCPSVYIQAPQWLRLLSVLTSDDAVVVDLLFIVAPIVLCCFMPVSI